MIGSREDAAAALYGELPHLDDGTSRRAYLSDGVVYKVNINDSWDDNLDEWNRYVRLKGEYMDPNVCLPETWLYEIDGKSVIAMEYIEGTGLAECYCNPDSEPHTDGCMTDEAKNLIRKYIDDLGGMNVILSDNIYYIIDIAC